MITFDGYYLKDFCIIKDVRRQIMPTTAVTMVDVQGRDGSYYFKRRREARVIDVDIMILGVSKRDIRNKAQALSEILDTEKPARLKFDDNPDVVYEAIVSGATDISEDTFYGTSTIQFICPDPYGYSENEAVNILRTGVNTIMNSGSEKAYPRYEITFQGAATYFSLISPDGITLVGDPEDVEKTTLPYEELVWFNDANDLTEWTVNTGINIENGTVTGTVEAVSSRIRAVDYGTVNPTGWHGPAIKHSLPTPLQNFKVDAQVSMYTDDGTQIGQVEIYLLDQNDSVIGVMRARDTSPDAEATHLQWRAGDLTNFKSLLVLRGFEQSYYADTTVLLRVVRRNSRWAVYSHKFSNDGTKQIIRPYWQVFEFNEGQFDTKQLASVVVHFGAHGDNASAHTALERIHVYKVNNVDEVINTPQIFHTGDKLVIDTASGKVLLNGEPFYEHLDPESVFAPLISGSTQIRYMTNAPVSVVEYHKSRWK